MCLNWGLSNAVSCHFFQTHEGGYCTLFESCTLSRPASAFTTKVKVYSDQCTPSPPPPSPPPMPPPSPPPPSPPPLLPGGLYKHVMSATFTVSGDVDSFPAGNFKARHLALSLTLAPRPLPKPSPLTLTLNPDSIQTQANLAKMLDGVSADDITLTLTAASVKVAASVILPSVTETQAATQAGIISSKSAADL